VAWAPDGQRIASASYDKTVRLWDAASGSLLRSLQGHENGVLSVAWAPDGQRIASASYDKTVRLWDAESDETLHVLEVAGSPSSVAWTPDDGRLAVSLDQGLVEIWEVAAGPPRLLGRLHHTAGGSGFAASADDYVSGPPEALETVRFGEGWALYDLTDLPERVSPERVAAAFNPQKVGTARSRKGRRKG
jgi:WD40 repeat protein